MLRQRPHFITLDVVSSSTKWECSGQCFTNNHYIHYTVGARGLRPAKKLIESGFGFISVSRAKERRIRRSAGSLSALHIFHPLSGKTSDSRPLHQFLWRDLVRRVVESVADVWKVGQGLAGRRRVNSLRFAPARVAGVHFCLYGKNYYSTITQPKSGKGCNSATLIRDCIRNLKIKPFNTRLVILGESRGSS